MFAMLLKKLGHDTTSGQIMPGIDGLRALAVPLTLLIAFFSYRYIELPFLAQAKNHARK